MHLNSLQVTLDKKVAEIVNGNIVKHTMQLDCREAERAVFSKLGVNQDLPCGRRRSDLRCGGHD